MYTYRIFDVKLGVFCYSLCSAGSLGMTFVSSRFIRLTKALTCTWNHHCMKCALSCCTRWYQSSFIVQCMRMILNFFTQSGITLPNTAADRHGAHAEQAGACSALTAVSCYHGCVSCYHGCLMGALRSQRVIALLRRLCLMLALRSQRMLALTDSCVSCYHSGYVASVELWGWIQAIDDNLCFFHYFIGISLWRQYWYHYDVIASPVCSSARWSGDHRTTFI